MAKITAFVTLTSPENRSVTLAPGDEVPEWAKGQISDDLLEKPAASPRGRKPAEAKED